MTQENRLQSGKQHLSSACDGASDSNHRLVSINPETTAPEGEMGILKVGNCVLCDSMDIRIFDQDFWLINTIMEILEVNEDKTCVTFKIGNSVYEVTVK